MHCTVIFRSSILRILYNKWENLELFNIYIKNYQRIKEPISENLEHFNDSKTGNCCQDIPLEMWLNTYTN